MSAKERVRDITGESKWKQREPESERPHEIAKENKLVLIGRERGGKGGGDRERDGGVRQRRRGGERD